MKLAVTALTCMFVGCGGNSGQAGPKDTALKYDKALAGGNYDQACSYLTADLRQTVSGASSEHGDTHCGRIAQVSPSVDLPKVGRSQQSGDSAQVEIDGAGGEAMVVALVRVDGRWLVNDVRAP